MYSYNFQFQNRSKSPIIIITTTIMINNNDSHLKCIYYKKHLLKYNLIIIIINLKYNK